MLFYLLIILIIITCLIVIGYIFYRKFPQLRTLEIKDIPEEQAQDKKADIIEGRLRRRAKNALDKLQKAYRWLRLKVTKPFWSLYYSLLKLEKRYQQQSLRQKKEQLRPSEIQQKIEALWAEAEGLEKQEDWSEAEKKYIAAISLDSQEIENYYRLAKVYVQLKDYEHAKECLTFALKLNNEAANCYYDLALIEKELGNLQLALENLQQAVKNDKNNPKYLNSLLELAIEEKDKFLAWSTYNRLKEANPENQKLNEYLEQLEELEREADSRLKSKNKT